MGETGEAGLSDFFKERFESDDSYVAQAEALRSLGKLGDRSAAGLLEEAAKMTSARRREKSGGVGSRSDKEKQLTFVAHFVRCPGLRS